MHLADLHYGKRLKAYNLEEEQRAANLQVIKTAQAEKLDAVLIAGDIFDQKQPSEWARNLYIELLESLIDLDLDIIISSGNHDSASFLNYGANFFKEQRIHISPVYAGKVSRITLKDDYDFYLLPYLRPVDVRSYFPEQKLSTYNEAVSLVLNKIEFRPGAKNILLSHQFVGGAQTSDSETIVVGGLENVSLEPYLRFDYVALGHLHRPQFIKDPKIRYAGSLLKYSFSECDQAKTISIVSLKEKLEIKEIKVKPIRDLSIHQGLFKDLMANQLLPQIDANNYLKLIVEDQNYIPHSYTKLSHNYPYILEYQRLHSELDQQISIHESQLKLDPYEVFLNFFAERMQKEASPEQKELLRECVEEINEDN